MVTLDHRSYPHIVDLILDQADWRTLCVLRQTSKALRARVDPRLARHVAIYQDLRTSYQMRVRGPDGQHFPGVDVLVSISGLHVKLHDSIDLFKNHTRVLDILGPITAQLAEAISFPHLSILRVVETENGFVREFPYVSPVVVTFDNENRISMYPHGWYTRGDRSPHGQKVIAVRSAPAAHISDVFPVLRKPELEFEIHFVGLDQPSFVVPPVEIIKLLWDTPDVKITIAMPQHHPTVYQWYMSELLVMRGIAEIYDTKTPLQDRLAQSDEIFKKYFPNVHLMPLDEYEVNNDIWPYLQKAAHWVEFDNESEKGNVVPYEWGPPSE